MGRRTLLLIASVLVAAVGTALVAIYVRGAEERAESGASLVTVLVAKENVPAGTGARNLVDEQLVATDTVLRRQAAPDAFTSATQLQPLANEGLVNTGPILAGQVIQRAMFGDSTEVTASGLEADQMRLAIQLNDPNRSAGFLQSGSDVAVFYTTGDGAGQRTQLLLDKVRVLSVGATVQRRSRSGSGSGDASAGATSATEDTVPTTIVSVAVNQAQAQKLIFSQQAGELYFAILQPGKKGDPALGATGSDNLFKP